MLISWQLLSSKELKGLKLPLDIMLSFTLSDATIKFERFKYYKCLGEDSADEKFEIVLRIRWFLIDSKILKVEKIINRDSKLSNP